VTLSPLKAPPITKLADGRYRIGSDYPETTGLKGHNLSVGFCELDKNGLLLLKSGFIWNGVSYGLDTFDAMMPSAVHDCFYRLMQYGYLPKETKPVIDRTYYQHLKKWKCLTLRARLHYGVLRLFGAIHMRLSRA